MIMTDQENMPYSNESTKINIEDNNRSLIENTDDRSEHNASNLFETVKRDSENSEKFFNIGNLMNGCLEVVIEKTIKEIQQKEVSNNNNDLYPAAGVPMLKQLLNARIKTSDVLPQSEITFEDFNLKRGLLMALYEIGWEWPSPIQGISIPLILQGKKLIARAKNGTGKTGAYAVGIINELDSNSSIQCVVLVPTRELALQTSNECINLAKYLKGINIMVSTGGTDVQDDICRLNNEAQLVQFLVATPGRALDFITHNQLKTKQIKYFVLDEADKLMSNDFKSIIMDIISHLEKDIQMILFSATYPESLKTFIDKYMQNSQKINLMNELTLKGVTQYYAYLKEEQKLSCLKILLKNLEVHQAIIFCSTMIRVELLAKSIINMGYSCYYTHAKMDQKSRNQVFVDFRAGHVRNLVCTDVMTRGIDIPCVNVVFNFDFPKHTETYLHRIGRCGRFGHLGIAINLITKNDLKCFFEIEQQLNCKIGAIPKDIDKRLYVASHQLESLFDENHIDHLKSVNKFIKV